MHLNKLIYSNLIWRGFFYFTSFALNIALVRILGAEFSGKLYFFLNNVSLALLIGSLSFESGITYYVSRGGMPENMLSVVSIIWSISISIIIAIFFLLFYNKDQIFFQNRFFLFACLSFTLGNLLNTYFNAFFYSYDNYRTPNLVAGSLNIILLFFVPWTPNWLGFIDIRLFLIIFFAANLIQGIVICLCWVLSRQKNIFENFSFAQIVPALKYSLAALIGNIAYFILYRIDYWFVEYYCTPKALGNYIQVSRVGQLLILPSIIMAGTLFPQSSKQGFSFESTIFKKLIWRVAFVYLLAGIFVLVFGRWIISFLWGGDYNLMYEPLVITMPGILFLAISYLFSPTFAGKGKLSYNIYISVFSLVVVIMCNFLMVPTWGIIGAAIATTVGFAVMIILYFIFAGIKHQFSFRSLFQ